VSGTQKSITTLLISQQLHVRQKWATVRRPDEHACMLLTIKARQQVSCPTSSNPGTGHCGFQPTAHMLAAHGRANQLRSQCVQISAWSGHYSPNASTHWVGSATSCKAWNHKVAGEDMGSLKSDPRL
jgi:hypothetical protein